MRIQSVEFKHTGPFLKLQLHCNDSPITVIYAQHGSGKTQLLKHLFHALTWFPARLKDTRTAGVVMPDQDITLQRVQSKISLTVSFPSEIGQLPESSDVPATATQECQWQLYKTLNAENVGISRVETEQLEYLTQLYRKTLQADAFVGLPVIAYYPTMRFIHEINLLSKNVPSTLQPHAAYDIATIPFLTFTKFFEWLREVSDLENAQTAHFLQHILNTQSKTQSDYANLQRHILNAQQHVHAPHLTALKQTLQQLFPKLSNIYIQYQPTLNLKVCFDGKDMLYQQLPMGLRVGIALIGDVVRRLCLLNPHSMHPCMDGQGIVLIDDIEQGIDEADLPDFLPKLQQAFPQLQIICTTSRQSLIDPTSDYQYLCLAGQTLQPIEIQPSSFHQWYSRDIDTTNTDDIEVAVEHIPAEQDTSTITQILQLIESLNPEQKQQLYDSLVPLEQEQQINPNTQR